MINAELFFKVCIRINKNKQAQSIEPKSKLTALIQLEKWTFSPFSVQTRYIYNYKNELTEIGILDSSMAATIQHPANLYVSGLQCRDYNPQ